MGIANGTRQPEMNVTPLIDVLLVLIIIFLVITPLAPKGLNTLVPQESDAQAPAAPSEDLVIEIAADQSLKLNSQPVALEELHAKLVDLWKHGANRVIFVKGAPDLHFADIAHVIDTAKGAGYSRVALMP